MSRSPASIMRGLSRLILPVLGRDLGNSGERVDIHYSERLDFNRLDMYQKSHYRRYEFACHWLRPDMLVGDMACGTGYGTVMMSKVAHRVYGYDLSPIIQRIKRRYAGYAHVTFQQSDLLTLNDIPKLNAIVSFETVEHFPEPLVDKLFKKFNHFLSEEGLLVFSTPYRQPPVPAARRHHRTFEIDETKATHWANEAGFRVEGFFYQNYSSHEVRGSLDPKDFMVGLCRKKRSV